MSLSKKAHDCEHCEKSYEKRGPKLNHKFSCHYGGYDCDKCPENYKSREVLNFHYQKAHGCKIDPKKDYGHLSKQQREDMDKEALQRKQTPPITNSDTGQLMVTMETTMMTEKEDMAPNMDCATNQEEQRVEPETNMEPYVTSITGTVPQVESEEPQVGIEICQDTDVIDLSTSEIVCDGSINAIVDIVCAKDIRLGINLKAEMYAMAKNAEKIQTQGELSSDEILRRFKPICNM
jgi:hypothetical protein